MAEDENTSNDDPVIPSPSERLALDDDAFAALPEEQQAFSRADLLSHTEEVTATATQAAQDAAATRQREADDRTRTEQDQRASQQTDIDWALDLDNRLNSTDQDVLIQARSDREADLDRYHRGLALKFQQNSDTTRTRIISEHYAPMFEDLKANGVGEFADWFAEHGKSDYGGNVMRAAVEYGRGLGTAKATAEAEDVAARAARIAAGAEGAPDLGTSGGNVATDNYENREWVEKHMEDPEWAFKMSDDGKLTNNQRVRVGVVAAQRRSA